jgi:hypothetical protein
VKNSGAGCKSVNKQNKHLLSYESLMACLGYAFENDATAIFFFF